MILPSTFTELIQQADTLKLYKKLIAQLNKDFTLANIPVALSETLSPIELKTKVQAKVYQLIQESFSTYLNLLYIIDVSEKKIKKLNGDNFKKLSEEVTFLILQREWQKVWLKNKY